MSKRKTFAISHFHGFLGNGSWLIATHTKGCARQRRSVTPSRRARELIPNPQCHFREAARARAQGDAA